MLSSERILSLLRCERPNWRVRRKAGERKKKSNIVIGGKPRSKQADWPERLRSQFEIEFSHSITMRTKTNEQRKKKGHGGRQRAGCYFDLEKIMTKYPAFNIDCYQLNLCCVIFGKSGWFCLTVHNLPLFHAKFCHAGSSGLSSTCFWNLMKFEQNLPKNTFLSDFICMNPYKLCASWAGMTK